MRDKPILTGYAIVAIGRITQDTYVARVLADYAEEIAIKNGDNFIMG